MMSWRYRGAYIDNKLYMRGMTEKHGIIQKPPHCYVHKKLTFRREAAWRFVQLNISLTYSRSLKVIENGTIRQIAHKSCWRSIVTMVLSRIISETKRDCGRKSLFFIPSEFDVTVLVGTEKLEWCGYPTVKKSLRMCLFVSTQYTNMTDRQTQTPDDGIDCAYA